MERTPDARRRRRVVRRWKRRARIAAPFLSLPLLLGTLALSVDLIEYRPETPEEEMQKQKKRTHEPRPERTAPREERKAELEATISRTSVVGDPLAQIRANEPTDASRSPDPWAITLPDTLFLAPAAPIPRTSPRPSDLEPLAAR